MLVSLQVVIGAGVPLKATPPPALLPKPVPVIVTEVPNSPVAGEILLITGTTLTSKRTPLLGPPGVVTTTLPVVAFEGTVNVMLLVLQLEGETTTPFKVTVLEN
jgi:hypothetical protein